MPDGITGDQIEEMVESWDEESFDAIVNDWTLHRLPYQVLPSGNWRRWILRCGRGTGKTHTGAKTTNEVAEDKDKIRNGEIGLIARTHTDARQTMVEGPSGILATARPDFRPTWEPGNGTLTWPNGVKGRIFSADKREQMRGPNWAWIWGDEAAFWPDADKTWWEVIEPALRIGWARCMITTTPVPHPFLKALEAEEGSVTTRAGTLQNPYLPFRVRETLRKRYEGTRIGRQELWGEYLEDNEHALWTHAMIEACRIRIHPDLSRVVVAVDPAVTANPDSDETGIITCGAANGHGYVLDDKSGIYTPAQWGRMALSQYYRHGADAIIAEVNNGGDLVIQNIRGLDDTANVIPVRASRGKYTRAEPISALYERGMVHHVGGYKELEDQQTGWDPTAAESPDRLDALVWGMHALLISDDQPAGPLAAYL